MNDKWNPRLWLRDWLLKPSGSEASIRERIASEVMAAVQEKMQAADERLSRSINAAVQGEPEAAAYGRPISASVNELQR